MGKITAFVLGNYKPFLIGGLVVLLCVFIRSYFFNKSELTRLKQNEASLLKEKDDYLISYKATTEEFANYLNYVSPGLEDKLDSLDIRTKRIEEVSIHNNYYRNQKVNTTNLDTILKAIKNSSTNTIDLDLQVPVVDVSPCLIVRGYIEFDGKKLDLSITDREFSSITEVISHIVRKQWKILGILPTRLFGKKELKVMVLNSCGETSTVVLTKSKGKWQRK